jgi:hypothetical protein
VAYARVKDLSGLHKDRMSRAFERLIATRAVERCVVKVRVGNNAERDAVGIRKVGATNESASLYGT